MNRPPSRQGWATARDQAKPLPDALSAEFIRSQLDRILASAQFRDALRLTRFLRFVVETTLTGNTACIKAYTIATEALGRDSDFDPQNDPIVRVEAGRLRQALARYYANDGRDDAVTIDVPRGTYVPTFQRRAGASPPAPIVGYDSLHTAATSAFEGFAQHGGDADQFDRAAFESFQPARAHSGQAAEFSAAPRSKEQTPPEQPRQSSSTRRLRNLMAPLTSCFNTKARIFKIAFTAIAVLAILEVVFDIDQPLVGGPNNGLWHKLWPATNATASQVAGSDGTPVIYVEPIRTVGHEVHGLFPAKVVRERLIDALAHYDDVTVVAGEPGSPAASDAQPPRSIYRLAATIRYGDEAATLFVQLIDAATGSIAWSRQYDRSIASHPRRPNDTIAPDVARSLLDPFGVIQAREHVKLAAVDPMKDTYLAFVYLRNYRFGIGARPGDPTMLANAYAMASHAVDIKPDSAFAQYALGSVLLAKGDVARAKSASDKSYQLNPDDGAVAFGHATMLILTGNVDAGLALLDKNAAKSPNSWIGYRLLKALGCYLKGDLNTAAAESKQIANPFFPPGLMLDALIADKAGDRARAQQDIAMLYQFYPGWQQNVRASVGRFLPEGPTADRIAADFKGAAADTMQ